MLNNEGVAELRERLTTIHDAATSFFDKAQRRQDEGREYSDIWDDPLTSDASDCSGRMVDHSGTGSKLRSGKCRDTPLTISGSERESDETATFTQLSSPAELRGTDVGHRHPLGHG